ncbi:hypothetical protein LEP1GSC058_1353 [Leptospira fainei serovar Hurstbridge str. BUT 6]|uniref:Lipoprotein n=1 Tax=Leptospira fainei serovar Hurstbridge str. BUT 6 TaxID=1193011 RepID=S3W8U4_9LEPT|nr:TIGR04452 family lipoprotein [Leptospira fainei]EPG76447.1 hypothetical protein LEP1GSC058_1353 [Leptospira fainei serovar Hurstbridge str. BUT 6]
MKKIISFIILSLAFALSNCIVLDMTGLSGSYKGSEAKKKIHDAAFTSDFLYYGSTPSTSKYAGQIAMIDAFLAEIFSNIEDGKYYKKTDVDKCIKDVQTIGLLVLDASTTVLTSSDCSKLKADATIL